MTNMLEMNQRVAVQGHKATVRWVGELKSTCWIGIEYDEELGKHDGTHEGTQYFQCPPLRGSFVKPRKIDESFTFEEALKRRYWRSMEEDHAECGPMYIVNPKTNFVKPIEFVGEEEVYTRQRNLGRLMEVSLANTGINSMLNTVPMLKLGRLTLDDNLITDFNEVCAELCSARYPNLYHVSASRNPFSENMDLNVCSSVESLILNSCDFQNSEVVSRVLHGFPNLICLSLRNNQFHTWEVEVFPKIKELNVDGNGLGSWETFAKLGGAFPNLETLTANFCELGDFHSETPFSFPNLKSLSMNSNKITEWSTLGKLVPGFLEKINHLRMLDNDFFVGDTGRADWTRQIIIALLPKLVSLNAGTITKRQRTNCERFFLSLQSTVKQMGNQPSIKGGLSEVIIKVLDGVDPDRIHMARLTQTHGSDIMGTSMMDTSQSLKHSLIQIKLVPYAMCLASKSPASRKVPMTMLLKDFLLLLARLFPIPSEFLKLQYCDPGFPYANEINLFEDHDRSLSFVGLSNDCEVRLHDTREDKTEDLST